jgi:hypothetical protein
MYCWGGFAMRWPVQDAEGEAAARACSGEASTLLAVLIVMRVSVEKRMMELV